MHKFCREADPSMARKEIVIILHEGTKERNILGFVFGREGATYRELREEIESGGLVSREYRFLGGQRMLPISERQEAMWEVTGDEVTIEHKSDIGSPSKRPRIDVRGTSNKVDGSSSKTGNLEEGGEEVRLKSKLASRSDIRKWTRDVQNAKEKLHLKGRADRFALMSKDKDGKALFQIWCEECVIAYGQGGPDTIYNFCNSHIKTLGHMKAMGVHDAKEEVVILKSSEEEIVAKNKERVDDAMAEVAAFAQERSLAFDLVTQTVEDYKTLSNIFIKCNLDGKWIPLFPKTGSIRQCMLEHAKSKIHVQASAPNSQDVTKKGGRPSKLSVTDERQKALTRFFKPISGMS